jgi:hypothetical protein
LKDTYETRVEIQKSLEESELNKNGRVEKESRKGEIRGKIRPLRFQKINQKKG